VCGIGATRQPGVDQAFDIEVVILADPPVPAPPHAADKTGSASKGSLARRHRLRHCRGLSCWCATITAAGMERTAGRWAAQTAVCLEPEVSVAVPIGTALHSQPGNVCCLHSLIACRDDRLKAAVIPVYCQSPFVHMPTEAYRLNAWHCVDTFVYFSHHLVTIPPPGWINAAHRNGVPVRTYAEAVQQCCALGPTLTGPTLTSTPASICTAWH